MRAVTARQLENPRDSLVSALGDDVGGAEADPQVGARRVAAHQDDALGPEALRGQHRHEADRPVADHRDRGPSVDTRQLRGVVPGTVHVGEGEQRREQLGVLGDGQHNEGAVCLGNPDRLGLAAADVARREESSVQARGLQSVEAELARAVGPGERRDDEVALRDRRDIAPDVFDHA